MSILSSVPLLVIGLAIGTALGYALATARLATAHASGRDDLSSLRAEAAQWRARAEELATRAELAEERSERDGSILRALAPVRSQLEQVGAKVEAMEKQRAAQHASLSEQLRAGAASERELRRVTTALEGALRSRTSRGVWGEVELARVLEASGMMRHVDFSEQRSLGSMLARRGGTRAGGKGAERARPDVVVHLPGDGHLAVDAKVPLDSYLAACEAPANGVGAQDAASVRAELLAAHAKALRGHVDALAERHYDRILGDSPELVVLFIPAEPILAAALDADPALMGHALDRGVALTTPASLLALLRTCAVAWARTAINDDARELLALGKTLYERLGTVASHMDSLGTALTRSVTAYNRAVGSLESRLLVTARTFHTLSGTLISPTEINDDAAQVRRLTSHELVGNSDTRKP